jgi:hypothetical protein
MSIVKMFANRGLRDLKPGLIPTASGTAEAVPFPKPFTKQIPG